MGRLSFIVSVLLVLCSCGGREIKVGVVDCGLEGQHSEYACLKEIVGDAASVEYVSFEDTGSLEGCDVVWYHRLDTSAYTRQESQAWDRAVRQYVENGGKLILSMEAVGLLNEWRIEPSEIERWEYGCIDEGFGRKLGFHSRFSHPLFDGLHGGAYPWHGKEDNICRVHGFDGDRFPCAEGSKVIACQWEYVSLRPEKKVIWETPVGKGSVLSIGSCIYFGRENHDREILKAFVLNCVDYMAGTMEPSCGENWWGSGTPDVIAMHRHHGSGCRICAAEYEAVRPALPEKMKFPFTEDVLSRPASREYTDVVSPRCVAILPEAGGIEEIWSHPVMSLRDFRVWIETASSSEPLCLSSFVPVVEVCPFAVVRKYDIDGLRIKEIVTASPDDALVAVHYEWEGEGLNRIYTDFKSCLRMMWPYDENVLGSLCYSWSPELNAMVFNDAGRKFISVVGGNVPGHPVLSGRYDGFTYGGGSIRGVETDLLQAGAVVSYDTEGIDALDIIMASSSEGAEKLVGAYSCAMSSPASVVEAACGYYSSWLDNVISVVTPDERFNEAFRWAQISCAQFIMKTPGLGTALAAGYSSSRRGWGGGHRVSGRPGYAWYFGRDSEWAAFAYADMGDFETVRDCIDMLVRHQSPDGKIYHEMSTSGVIHYDAADATPLLVNLMAHYLRLSADVEFAAQRYSAIVKAIDYCFSTDRDGDGLIENICVGHGWLEGGSLWGFQTEFYLCGIWKAALEDAAYIASVTGHNTDSQRYMAAAGNVSGPLEKFWNEDRGWYNWSLNEDDTYQDDFLVLTAVPVYFGVLDKDRAHIMAQKYTGPLMSTDWGARTVYETSDAYGGGAYHPRNVWPLFTGWKSLAEYKEGFYDSGFASLYGSLLTYKSFSLGHIAEVINGDNYRNNGITQHQCWSETMTIMPFVEGTIGFVADAPSGRFALSPRLPLHWDSFDVCGLRVGDKRISMSFARTPGRDVYTITGGNGLKCGFSPAFAPLSKILEVYVDGKPVIFGLSEVNSYLVPSADIDLGKKTVVEIVYEPGVGVLPVVVEGVPGKASSGFRIVGQQSSADGLSITVSGRPGAEHILKIRAPEGISSVSGAEIAGREGDVTALKIFFPADGEIPYSCRTVSVKK